MFESVSIIRHVLHVDGSRGNGIAIDLDQTPRLPLNPRTHLRRSGWHQSQPQRLSRKSNPR